MGFWKEYHRGKVLSPSSGGMWYPYGDIDLYYLD